MKNKAKMMNMVYGIGASIVILGALFKLMHWPGGNIMLIVGLITEAVIFFISAFEIPKEELDWTLAYPELKDNSEENAEDFEPRTPAGMLSKKIDGLLESAKLDVDLIEGLSKSIKGLETRARSMTASSEAIDSTHNYTQQIELAAEHVKSLNELYINQLENSSKHANINEKINTASDKVKEGMESLADNLSTLNNVYGGMLTAMENK